MLTAARVLAKEKASKIAGSDNLSSGGTVIVRNRGSESVDLGGSSVKTGEGFELKAGDREEFRGLGDSNALYAVAAAGKEVRLDVITI